MQAETACNNFDAVWRHFGRGHADMNAWASEFIHEIEIDLNFVRDRAFFMLAKLLRNALEPQAQNVKCRRLSYG